MRWAEIEVRCPPESADAVSYAFLEAGCGGVLMEGTNPVTARGSLPVSDELTERLRDLKDHLDRLPEFGLPGLIGEMTLRYAEEEDWANAWKQYFKPLRVGKRLTIKPSWEEYAPQDDELVLELDPGMAFGTGGHPTTKLCMLALEDYVTPGMKVADIGTGSGILALAAARLGATQVLATDIDLLPRRTARENVARNGLDLVVSILEMDAFDKKARDCDLIVANIVAATIIELIPSVRLRLKPDGLFLCSGIVEEYHGSVKKALEDAGFDYLETRSEDIWVCLAARRKTTDDAEAEPAPPLSRADHNWAKL